jgi:pyruvate/2-oxoglutarate/acetoin dehydrogenase E1 component
MFMSAPGLKIVMPYTPREARAMLRAAIRDDGPVLFVEHKLLYGRRGEVPVDDAPITLGSADVLRAGEQVTIVSWGKMLDVVGQALNMMEEKVSAEVINLRSLKPMDVATIASSVEKTGHLVIVEEGVEFGGVGAEVAAQVAEDCLAYLAGPVVRVGMPDVSIPASRPLEDFLLPRPEQVVEAIEKSMGF